MDILAQLAVLFDNENALRVCVGEVMGCETESFKSAEHTEAFNSAHFALLYLALRENSTVKSNGNEVALLDVLCVCNYLYGSFRADVHLTYEQRVSVLVRAL